MKKARITARTKKPFDFPKLLSLPGEIAMSAEHNNESKGFRGRNKILSAAMLALMSAGAGANCIPLESPPTSAGYWELPYNLTTTDTATKAVSYSTGMLVAKYTDTWSTSSPQLFNNREYVVPNTCTGGSLINTCVMQPFSAVASDKLGVAVSNYPEWGIFVGFTLESWGNVEISMQGTCDSVTGVLYGSGSWPPYAHNVFYTLAFGTPTYIESAR